MTATPRRGAARSAIVSVGNELLFGQTVDTNAAWLGAELSTLGAPVRRHHTVPDDAEAISEAVARASAEADLVLVTGGLGPTADDLTREAVAGLLGRSLVLDEARLARLAERFRARGLGDLPATNAKQAQIPEGATVLENPHGTAPGLALEHEGTWIVLLPGVPREMRGIFETAVAELAQGWLSGRLRPLTHRLIRTTGVAESRLAELIEEAFPTPSKELGEQVSIAYLPDVRGVDLRLTIAGEGGDADDEELDRVEALLAPVVAPWRFEAGSGDVAEAVLEALRAAGATFAVAESCTAGMVAARLTDHAGASDVFFGGVISYANSVKEGLVGVSHADLVAHGAVSEPVARQMAEGVVRATGADYGLGVTGIAGPGGGSPEKPVGTVWLALHGPTGTLAKQRRFLGDRTAVRERATQAALALVLEEVRGTLAGP